MSEAFSIDAVRTSRSSGIALGYPMGVSGRGRARVGTVSLELERRDPERNLAAMCNPGGMVPPLIVERD